MGVAMGATVAGGAAGVRVSMRRHRQAPRRSMQRMALDVGSKVRVSENVTVYNEPKNGGNATELKGMEGVVKDVVREHNGIPLSPITPFVVAFEKDVGDKKVTWTVHLGDEELEEL